MNIFKGLLFLHGHVTAADTDDGSGAGRRDRYGASTVADDLAAPLGNRAATRQWLGGDPQPASRPPPVGCIAGGCG